MDDPSIPLGRVRFDRPPVGEVALAIHFEETDGRTTAGLGAFWFDCLRDVYVQSRDMPLATNQLEVFGEGARQQLASPFAEFTLSPVSGSRIWCLTGDERMIVQLQRDRIVLNWRKLGDGDEYPEYSRLRKEFLRIAGLLESRGEEFGLWPLAATQTEVTYINQIERSAIPTSGILATMPMNWPNWFGVAENFQMQQTFLSATVGGRPSRLYVTVAPSDSPARVQLNLTCKGRPSAGSWSEALEMLNLGHERIVHAFAEIISAESQDEWGMLNV